MKISTEINSMSRLVSMEKVVELVAKVGFDAWDFSLFKMAQYSWTEKCVIDNGHPLSGKDYLKYARLLRRIGQDNGIYCNQSHAPFPVYSKDVRSKLKNAIECTAEAGGSICVIHPDNNKSATENAEMFFELLPFAKQCGVKIATENMWNWDAEKGHAKKAACSHHDDFKAHIDAVNDPYFVACLDIGHAEMKGLDTSCDKMIRTLNDKLQALHIHDNDLINDSHAIPNSMKIDFDVMLKALKDIDYKGHFTLEADQHYKNFTEQTVEICARELYQSAKKLADKFEQLK